MTRIPSSPSRRNRPRRPLSLNNLENNGMSSSGDRVTEGWSSSPTSVEARMHNAVSPLPRAVFRRREPLHTDAKLYELVHDTGTPRAEVGSQSCGSCVRGQLPKQNMRTFTARAVGGRKYSYACSRVVSHSNNKSLCSCLSASLLLYLIPLPTCISTNCTPFHFLNEG